MRYSFPSFSQFPQFLALILALAGPWGLMAQKVTLGTQTQGLLPISQGGTNATSAPTALSNLGGIGPSTTDTLSNKTITSPKVNDLRGYSTGLQLLLLGDTASAVNYVGIYNNIAGQAPKVAALGSDANVDLQLRPQGTGKVDLGAIGAVRITGCTSGQYPRFTTALGDLGCDAGGGGGGAPTSATYITQTPDATLSAEQALSLLPTGLLKVTTSTGVLSTATASDLPAHASSHQLGGSDQLSLDGSLITAGTVADARLPSSMAGKTFTSAPKIIVASDTDRRLVIQSFTSTYPTCEGAGYLTFYSLSGTDRPEVCAGTTRYSIGNTITGTTGNTGKIPYYQTDTTISGLALYDISPSHSSFPLRDTDGTLRATRFSATPDADLAAGVFRRYSAAQASYLTAWNTELNATLSYIRASDGAFVGAVIGNASTASSLLSDPSDCPATGFATTINSAGNLGCRAADLSTADTTGLLPITKINATGTPSATTYLRGDGTWATAGGGNVSGPGSSTNLYFPQWSGTTGTLLGAGVAGTTAAAASSVLTTNSYGATKLYDLGGQVYNVKAYGATGNGVTDDTAALQAAFDACQNSTDGGTIFVPPGVYGITAQLTLHNGTATTVSTQKSCRLEGTLSGADDSSGDSIVGNHPGASVIRWIGTAPGSPTYMLKLRGPAVGGAIDNIAFNASGVSNVGGIYINHITHLSSNNLVVAKWTVTGMVITVDTTAAIFQYGACDNTFTHLRLIRPASGGNGLLLDGNAQKDACSNTFYAPMIWHDNATAGTWGIKLITADNNRFFGANVYGYPDTSANGSAILFQKSTVNTAFPHENSFYSLTPMQGITGTPGTGQPNNFISLNNGDCFHNCDLATSLTAGGTPPIIIGANGTDQYWMNRKTDTNSNDYIDTFDNTNATGRSGINLRRARGTPASPATILSGDRMGLLAFWGYVTGGYIAPATIEAYASTVSGASVTSYVDIQTANAGTRSSTLKISPAGLYFGGVGPGLSSTFVAGACTLTFSGGILTSKSGC